MKQIFQAENSNSFAHYAFANCLRNFRRTIACLRTNFSNSIYGDSSLPATISSAFVRTAVSSGLTLLLKDNVPLMPEVRSIPLLLECSGMRACVENHLFACHLRGKAILRAAEEMRYLFTRA